MATLSLAMIVKNEEAVIGKLLERAEQFCDELVVVDTGSTDMTRDVISDYGASFRFPWMDDFAAARNYAFGCCTCDWIIWLDADDVIPDATIEAIKKLKKQLNDSVDAVYTPYNVWFDRLNNPTFGYLRERFIRRQAGLRWEGILHETIAVPSGRSITNHDIVIEHRPLPTKKSDPDRNLRIFKKMFDSGDRSPRTMFYYANELYDRGRYGEALGEYISMLSMPLQHWERYHVLRRIGSIHNLGGNVPEALNWLSKATVHDSARAEAFCEIGILFHRQGRCREAIPFFVAATEIPKPTGSCFLEASYYSYLPWEHLVMCYWATGQVEKCKEAVLKSVKDNPNLEWVDYNLKWLQTAPEAPKVLWRGVQCDPEPAT